MSRWKPIFRPKRVVPWKSLEQESGVGCGSELAPFRSFPRPLQLAFLLPVLAVLFLDLGLSATEYTLLNFAWALAIVFTDLPAGVLADRIGRKPLVVAAALFMVLEMILLSVAPFHGGIVLLLCCLGNRILSGMAEGMASGADEALVFDSLAERQRSNEWPKVFDHVMRWQGLGMMIAMLVGGAVYDPIS